ncbi:MAG: endoflagellar motor protein [Deltaproteobacteria bacterium]|nr:MAG: endoflagellar motor protein [Deltaproteobacteria bacterium]
MKLPAVAALLVLSTGCVKKKDYDALQAELESTRNDLTATLAERDATIAELQQALADEQAEVARLQAELDKLRSIYEEETAVLRAQQAELLKDRSSLRARVEEVKAALAEAAKRKAAAEARVAQFRDMLDRFQALIDAGRLKVRIVDGRMVVVMATDILFESGKADLSEEGRKALAEVGAVLASIPDRSFQVEGHTDNVPISTSRFHNNWELGSARAVSVVETLIEAGVPPERLSAASYAEFHPVASNDTPEGRAANRRIEIVVVPDLSQLPGAEDLAALTAEQDAAD